MMLAMSEVIINNAGDGNFLSVTGAGESAKLGRCPGESGDGLTERWRLVPVAGMRHQYQIQSVTTGMVVEITGESYEERANVGLWEDNGGIHQRWRLVPVGEGEHEYAIINVRSGKAISLLDEAWRDDDPVVQTGYGHRIQQRWVLTVCNTGTVSRAVMTIVRDESVFFPIWLRYYRRFFSARDIYVLDHQSSDGSTEGGGFTRVAVTHPEYGAAWQRDVIQSYQHELSGRYDVVLYTDVDEIVAPDPRRGDLGTYIDHFSADFVTCQGYEILHQKDHEPPFDPAGPVLGQRFTWYANPSYSKSLLARVPMLWHGGCHERVDGRKNSDSDLYLLHLHRMDYDICLARHRDRTRFPLAQIDRDQGWGYQNMITDPTEFSSWFFHDSGGPLPLCPQPIPPWWRDLV